MRSPRRIGRQRPDRGPQPPDERVDGADPGDRAGPRRRGSRRRSPCRRSDRPARARSAAIRPSIGHRAVADRRAARPGPAGWRPGGPPSCTGCARPRRRRTRTAAARPGRTRPASTRTRSTPEVRPVTLGRPVWSSGDGRGEEPDRGERGGRAGRARRSRTRRSSSSRTLGWSRNSRSSPLTEKISALAFSWRLPSTPEVNRACSRNSAKLVLVATPEIPEIDTCAPRVPSRNSRLR